MCCGPKYTLASLFELLFSQMSLVSNIMSPKMLKMGKTSYNFDLSRSILGPFSQKSATMSSKKPTGEPVHSLLNVFRTLTVKHL